MEKIYDVAIIGSGPSGLTAAIYTSRGAASTIILGGETWGGQLMLTTEVDNFPGHKGIMGPDLMAKMKDHATAFDADFVAKSVTSVDFQKRPFTLSLGDTNVQAKSVIIATGAQTVWLDAPGIAGLIGKGVSSCAPCDAPFFKDKKVAVVGGGDSAMEEALVLTKYASDVFIIHRRDKFRASYAMQEKVMNNPKIKIMWNTEIVEAFGENKLTGLKLKNSATQESLSDLEVDGLFVAIGHTPMTDIFKNKIDLDEKGFIKIKEGSKTNIDGVFVSGDVHDHKYKQAITAAGFGCMAAMEALEFLSENNG